MVKKMDIRRTSTRVQQLLALKERRSHHDAQDSSDTEGCLQIGGVRLKIDSRGNIADMSARRGGGGPQSRSTRNPRRAASPPPADFISVGSDAEDRDMNEEDMLDYLQNTTAAEIDEITEDEGGDDGDEGEAKEDRRGRGFDIELLRRLGGVELGDEGAVEDILDGWPGSGAENTIVKKDEEEDCGQCGETSEYGGGEDEEEEGWDGGEEAEKSGREGSALSFCTGSDFGDAEEDGGDLVGVFTAEELERLSAEERYPVQARPAPVATPPTPSAAAAGVLRGKYSWHRSGYQGAQGGQLPPGEKGRMRKEKIKKKRADRAVDRGFDLAAVNEELQAFVERQMDYYAFPPLPKYECSQIVRLAKLYKSKAGAQGSGHKRSVFVLRTYHTELPQGEELREVERLLAENAVINYSASHQYLTREAAKAAARAERIAYQAKNNAERKAARKAAEKMQQPEHYAAARAADAAIFAAVGDRGSWPAGAGTAVTAAQFQEQQGQWAQHVAAHLPQVQLSKKQKKAARKAAQREAAAAVADRKRENRNMAEMKRAGAAAAVIAQHRQRNFNAPVAFVSRGVVNPDDVPAVEIHVPEDEQQQRAALGLIGAGTSSSGAQQQQQQPITVVSPRAHRGAAAADGITNPGRLLGLGLALGIGAEVFGGPSLLGGGGNAAMAADVPSPLHRQLSKAEKKRLQRARAAAGAGGAEDQKNAAKRRSTGDEFGGFEAHTTGIGSKLLAKWGFNGPGGGLGKAAEGISEPIQVQKRAKGLGLGA